MQLRSKSWSFVNQLYNQSSVSSKADRKKLNPKKIRRFSVKTSKSSARVLKLLSKKEEKEI